MKPTPFQLHALADAVLVKMAGGGDAPAFAALYARHKDYAMRLAVRFTRDHETAADVVQETFIYLVRKMPTLELTAKMTTYLYPIVKNIALTAKRKDKARLRLVRDDGSDIDVRAPATAEARNPESLASVVAILPEHQQEVLLMRFVDDMSMEQIATALSIPAGTVKSRLHLAIKILREDPRTRGYFDVGTLGSMPDGGVP